MPSVTTAAFKDFVLQVGDGGTPETFGFIVGMTSKGISFTSDTETSAVPDALDEGLPSFNEVDVVSQGASMTASGMWARENHGFMLNWWRTGAAKNVRVRYATAASGSPEYYAGPAVLTKLDHNGDKGARVKASITIEFARAPTVTNKP